MNFLSQTNPAGLRVLVRLDLDLPIVGKSFDFSRLEDGLPSLDYLFTHQAKSVTIIAHRQLSKSVKANSLLPIAKELYSRLLARPPFKKINRAQLEEWLTVRENLRLDPREEAEDLKFGRELSQGFDLYCLDAFATSHRQHTSIVILPALLPTVLGLRFEKELKALNKLINEPKRPFICLLGGAKLETKLPLIEKLSEQVDVILLGGKLALEAKEKGLKNRRMIVAQLTEDTLDINEHTQAQFERFVTEAKTLVWNGPMGKFEDQVHAAGTRHLAEIMTTTGGYKVMGGGDTESALSQLHFDPTKMFNFVSSGGGSLLYYVAYHTLPALEALKNSPPLEVV